ncbi:MAG: hypothetical protein K6A44_05510 [bacterium]|nr:hypothetical protein [bacterium]
MDDLFEIICVLIVAIPVGIILGKWQNSKSTSSPVDKTYMSELDYMFNFKPKTPEEFTQKADICLKHYRENDALENITKAIEMEPSAQRYIISAKIKNSFSIEDYDGALTDLYAAMRLATDKDELAEIYKQKIEANWHQQNSDKEIVEDCNALLEIYPDNEYAYLHLGLAYEALKDIKAAHENYDKVLQINDRNSTAYYRKYDLFSQEGKKQEALDCINKAIECSPDDEVMDYAYSERGSLYLELGDYERALRDFDIYISKNKESSIGDFYDTYQKMGIIKENIGDYEGALADYNEALKLIEVDIIKLPENKEKYPTPEVKWDEYEKQLKDDKQKIQIAIENLKNFRNV